MKILKNIPTQVILTLSLILFLNISLAQKQIIFSNNQENAAIEGNAFIDVTNGNITVKTIGEKLIIDAQQAQLAFYPNTYALSSPGNITVNWTVAYATTCTASVEPGGNANNWAGSQTSDGSDDETVYIGSLPTTLKMTCTSSNGGPNAVKTFTIVESTGNNQGNTQVPSIDKFEIVGFEGQTTPTVTEGNAYTIHWEVSNLDGGTCLAGHSTPSNNGGWTGSFTNANGSQNNVTISGAPTLSLTCNNNNGTGQSKYIYPQHPGGGQPQSCQNLNIQPPAGMAQRLYTYTDPRNGNYPSKPGSHGHGAPFLEAMSNTVNYQLIPDQQYVTLQGINVPSTHDEYITLNGNTEPHLYRSFSFGNSWGNADDFASIEVSISTCPGDFDTNKSAICRAIISVPSTFGITTDASDPYLVFSNNCLVTKNQNYYLNFMAAKELSPPYERKCVVDNPRDGKCGSLMKEDAY